MSLGSEQARAYVYRILVAIGVLLTGYGILTANEVAMWLGLVTAVLNVLPTANTTTKK